MIEGLVIKSTGSWYEVALPDGERIQCRIIGKFRLAGKKLTNPVAVGDRVLLEKEMDDKGLIKEILPRKTTSSANRPERSMNYICSPVM